MNTFMDFEEHQAMKEKRIKKIKKKSEQNYSYDNKLKITIKKKDNYNNITNKKSVINNNSDYEDTTYRDYLYNLDYDINKIK